MQPADPSPLLVARVLAILAVLAALLPGCAMSWIMSVFACFDTCSTPDYYFVQLAPREALFMLPCVALAVFSVAVFVPYCQATHQTGRALCVFLFFLVGGLLGAAGLYGLAQLAVVTTSSADSLHINQQAANWMGMWTLALLLVTVAWSGTLAVLQWPAEWSPEAEQRWRRVGQPWRRLIQRAAP
jgi:hypothetical protein